MSTPGQTDSTVTTVCKQTGRSCSLLKGPRQKAQQRGKAAAQSHRKDYFRSKPSPHVAQTRNTTECSSTLYLPFKHLR